MTLRDSTLTRLAGLGLLIAMTLVMVNCGGGSSSPASTTTTPTTPATNNSVALTAGAGPGGYSNELFTTVTICAHGSTSTCQTINNILVDSGSVGLRIIASALTIPQTSLGAIQDSTQDQLQECIQYGDTSYSWGPMWLADVSIAGETASNVPIQVIGGNAGNATFATVPSQCLYTAVLAGTPNGGNEDTPQTFGANGILGVGTYAYDCGSFCTVSSDLSQSGYPYYICPTGGTCTPVTVPTQYQAVNPVPFFSSSDNNGVVITLPSIAAAGAASASGTMYFGIGTQSNNALGSAVVYALNSNQSVPMVTYNSVAYSAFNIFDTGSNTLAIGDGPTLGISDCADLSSIYCPSSTVTLSNISLTGNVSGETGTTSVSIANADQLLSNSANFVFNDLGSESGGTGPANDIWDFGLPFFYGKTVFVGIAGTSLPSGVSSSVTNGFFAF